MILEQSAKADVDASTMNGHPRTNGYANGHPRKYSLNGAVKTPVINGPVSSQDKKTDTVLSKFLQSIADLEAYKRESQTITVDGQTLSIPAVTALARDTSMPVSLSSDPEVRARVEASRATIQSKVDSNQSIYGVSTGYGGSADTRTSAHAALGLSLLQHLHAGVIHTPETADTNGLLPLMDPLSSTAMPESWVRAAILIRANALVRGHSGVRFELIDRLLDLLRANITPLVPIRGSISASGDLQPLAYVAGTLIGSSSIRVFCGPKREIVPASSALASHSLTPLVLLPKEPLGLLNGTAFAAALAALVLHDSLQLAVLSQALTALGTEALLGTRASHAKFIHEVCRPHPGQVEVAQNVWWLLGGSKLATGGDAPDRDHLEEEVTVEEDSGKLRQDRYPLRTSPQFLGPQLEDILSAAKTVELECNTTTDNPLIDSATDSVHHGGNFQAMSVTSAMEKTRLALFHIGKLMFAQSTEILNPVFNRGLPPSVAATDPSLNYHAKGLDTATASYTSELGWLSAPVGVHAQSAEMHNQAVNSLALISARATVQSLQVLSILMASYLYILCQAVDLRALQAEHAAGLQDIVHDELSRCFANCGDLQTLEEEVMEAISASLESTSTMDVDKRMDTVADASTVPLFRYFRAPSTRTGPADVLGDISAFHAAVSSRSAALLKTLRIEYLEGKKGPAPASRFLGRTRVLYEYVRVRLGVKMHGRANLTASKGGLEGAEDTIGANVSVICEAIKDGRMGVVLAKMFQG